MPTPHHKTDLAIAPALAGLALALGACGLLAGDMFSTGHVTLNHLLRPLLVFASATAAVWAHRSFALSSYGSAFAFFLVAFLGSLAIVYGTLGRLADNRDVKVGSALAQNRTLQLRNEALDTAKTDAKKECSSGVGQKCSAASARVDKLVGDMATLRTTSPDPRGDALADLLYLTASVDKDHTRNVVAAVDPLILPVFLELGSVVFFAGAFRVRKVEQPKAPAETEAQPLTVSTATAPATERQALSVVPATVETVESDRQPYSRDAALRDLRELKSSNSQQFLANRWGVSEGTCSKWMALWESQGEIDRARNGKAKQMVALSERRSLPRPRLGHMRRA